MDVIIAAMDGLMGGTAKWWCALIVVSACGGGGSSSDSSSSNDESGDTSTDASTSATTASTTSAATTTTVDESTSEPAESSGTSESSTSGGPTELCNGWQTEGPASPWLSVYDDGHVALASGGTLALVCGGQGSWMFPIYPELGGWDIATDNVTFSVTIDVEGFNDTPTGHFFFVEDLYYDLVCHVNGDELDGGFLHNCIAVLPPDTITDLGMLDGAATTIHIELAAPDGPVVIDLTDMTISAPPETIGEGCVF